MTEKRVPQDGRRQALGSSPIGMARDTQWYTQVKNEVIAVDSELPFVGQSGSTPELARWPVLREALGSKPCDHKSYGANICNGKKPLTRDDETRGILPHVH